MPKDNPVEKLAELARIDLTKKEKEQFEAQLKDIVEYVSQISEAKTEGVTLDEHVTKNVNVWREDVVENCPEDIRDAAVEAFPASEGTILKVPGVFENRTE